MLKPVLLLLAVPLAVAGCAASPPPNPAASLTHPANPDAAEAPLPPPSQVLTAAPPSESVPPADNSATPMGHTGHDMGAMGGMGHDMAGMTHTMPTSQPATSQPAALYTCVMHPEVVSNRPGKCPKCGMKLVPKKDVMPSGQGRHQ